ncbi:hypothetical protein H2508_14035 [Parahaliea sp. F7430]|uniref:Histidine kinase/HSP90-like ATPase domain-containing protein n=1 Tax=Sediminihaliea albiluteola TaxID=2758564 RepID=A0A7W2YKJ1_9GAMM|nr:two-component regulator propeller domain-containing protein [Sediminihaliea albiluteola]MBA6414230.1 hypothetical protein [Sediminihaliea albiluteola]
MMISITSFSPSKTVFLIFYCFFQLLLSTLSFASKDFHPVVQNTGNLLDLTNNTVTSILHGPQGRLWIGTHQGLYKYDGNKPILYTPKNRIRHYIPESNISDIDNSESGTIWLSTYGGTLSRYNPLNDSFIPASTIKKTPKLLSITKISATFSEVIWIGTRNGVTTYLPKISTYSELMTVDSDSEPIGRIIDIVALSPTMAVATTDRGLYSLEALGSLTKPSPPSLVVTNINHLTPFPTTLSEPKKDSFWLGSTDGEIAKISSDLTIVFNTMLPESASISSIIDNGNLVFIGTDKGIWIYNYEKDTFSHINDKNSLLSNNHITSLYFFDELLWVGTYNGLNLITASQFNLTNSANSIIKNEVLAIESDSQGSIWIGTYEGLFHKPHLANPKLDLTLGFQEIEIPDERIMSLAAKNDDIWIGTRHNGVFTIDINRLGTTKQLLPGSLSNAAVTSILHMDNNTSWVGTYNYGLLKIDSSGVARLKKHPEKEKSLTERSITLLSHSEDKKTFIVGSENNLYLYSPTQDIFKSLNIELLDIKNKPTFLSLFQSSRGTTWLGTLNHGPLLTHHKLDGTATQRLSRVTDHPTLSSSAVYAFQEDDQENIWASTSTGIYLLNYRGQVMKRFGVSDGLQGNDFNFGASHKDHKGRIYFGGSNGYNRFDPSEVTLNETVPPMLLTNLKIAGQSPTFNKAIHDITSVELNHKDYYVNFEFSALDYLDPANNIYRYKLLGFDPDWVDIGNRNSATYTNLPAGDYTLHIQGASASGVWNREGISVQIKVNPPPWLSWWAYSLYALLAAFIAWHIKRIYDNYVIRERAIALAHDMQVAADRASDEIQEQLDQQSILVETIHHFNLDQLAYVQRCFERYSDLLPADLADALSNDFNNRIEAFICLENALYYRFEELLADLHAYTESLYSILLRAENQPQSSVALSQISIINLVSTQLIPAQLALPLSIVIYELLSNAIVHAFEQDSRSCFIRISLEECPDLTSHFKLLVQDNGIGMPANISLENPDTEGMRAVVQAIRHLNGTLQIERDSGTKVLALVPIPEPRF